MRHHLVILLALTSMVACGGGEPTASPTVPTPVLTTAAAEPSVEPSTAPTTVAPSESTAATETASVPIEPSETVLPTDQPTIAPIDGQLVYDETFDDPSAETWGSGEQEGFSYGYADGGYLLTADGTGFFISPASTTVPRHLFGSTTVETTFTMRAGGADSYFAVICWKRSQSDFYSARIYGDGRIEAFGHSERITADGFSDEPIELMSADAPADFDPRVPNRLRFVCADDHDTSSESASFELYLNDEQVGGDGARTAVPTEWTYGRVAMLAQASEDDAIEVLIDDFSVVAEAPRPLDGTSSCTDSTDDLGFEDEFPGEFQGSRGAFDIVSAAVSASDGQLAAVIEAAEPIPTTNDTSDQTYGWNISLDGPGDLNTYLRYTIAPGQAPVTTVTESNTGTELTIEPVIDGAILTMVVPVASVPIEAPMDWKAYTRVDRETADPNDFDETLLGDDCPDSGQETLG